MVEQSVRKWIEDLPKHGCISFSMENLELQFPDMPKETIRSLLYRLVSKGCVCSVWKEYVLTSRAGN